LEIFLSDVFWVWPEIPVILDKSMCPLWFPV
jgi:hypothetical protein